MAACLRVSLAGKARGSAGRERKKERRENRAANRKASESAPSGEMGGRLGGGICAVLSMAVCCEWPTGKTLCAELVGVGAGCGWSVGCMDPGVKSTESSNSNEVSPQSRLPALNEQTDVWMACSFYLLRPCFSLQCPTLLQQVRLPVASDGPLQVRKPCISCTGSTS